MNQIFCFIYLFFLVGCSGGGHMLNSLKTETIENNEKIAFGRVFVIDHNGDNDFRTQVCLKEVSLKGFNCGSVRHHNIYILREKFEDYSDFAALKTKGRKVKFSHG